MGTPVVFNLGMGVESAAALVRLLEDDSVRDFDLADLVVITSMTGDEFPDTGRLVETHILPLLAEHGVRYVQVARRAANRAAAGGPNVAVLSDSRETTRVFLDGCYKLSDEMLSAGTLPTTAGDRLCSMHSKGEVIDEWIVLLLLGCPAGEFRQMIGFNADETGRADDDRKADAKRKAKGQMLGRRAEFPLVAWGWNREKCLDFLRGRFGVEWKKSCCSYCPFARGKAEVVARFREFPKQAADAAWMEHLSLALNPRLKLYGTKSVLDVLTKDGNAAAVEAFNARLNDPAAEWVVYRVRRLYRGVGLADRHVGVVFRGTRMEAETEVRRLARERGIEAGLEDGSWRAVLHRRAEPPKRKRNGPKVVYKGVEEMIVACPRTASEKAARGWKEESWDTRISLAIAGAPEPVGCGG